MKFVKFDVLLPVKDIRAFAKGIRMFFSKPSIHLLAPAFPVVCEAMFCFNQK
jgi:hypothetical protein